MIYDCIWGFEDLKSPPGGMFAINCDESGSVAVLCDRKREGGCPQPPMRNAHVNDGLPNPSYTDNTTSPYGGSLPSCVISFRPSSRACAIAFGQMGRYDREEALQCVANERGESAAQ